MLDDLVITDLARDDKGYWQAIVQVGDQRILASRRWGSWQVHGPEHSRDVLYPIAVELQRLAKKLEKAERD